MLSDRIRPNSEAAPWVVEEVKKLEALLQRCFYHLDLEPGNAVIPLRRDIEAAIAPATGERHCAPCDGTVTKLMIQQCGFGRCPNKARAT